MLAKYNDGGCRDDFVERAAAGPAADPLVGLLERRNSRTRGSGADEGVRPTFCLRLWCIVGQVGNLRRVENRLLKLATRAKERRLPTGAQDAILPHNF